MTQVYIADCTSYQSEQVIARVLPILDTHRQEKIHSLQTIQKKAQSAVAGLLLAYVFSQDATYQYADKGKPYLTDNRAYFSLSHSDKWVALAVSDAEIGFDLQAISPIRPAVLRRCFTPEEQAWVEDDAVRFTQLWAQKEAYGKYTGHGLTIPFSSIFHDDSILHCEGQWEMTCYALYGDDQVNITQIKDLL